MGHFPGRIFCGKHWPRGLRERATHHLYSTYLPSTQRKYPALNNDTNTLTLPYSFAHSFCSLTVSVRYPTVPRHFLFLCPTCVTIVVYQPLSRAPPLPPARPISRSIDLFWGRATVLEGYTGGYTTCRPPLVTPPPNWFLLRSAALERESRKKDRLNGEGTQAWDWGTNTAWVF